MKRFKKVVKWEKGKNYGKGIDLLSFWLFALFIPILVIEGIMDVGVEIMICLILQIGRASCRERV